MMHDYRRRPEDLKAEQTQGLEALFDKVPLLGVIYHQRWEATQIFDTAVDRVTAAQALKDWIAQVRATELDWEPFITMLEGHWDGILAYFDDRRSSGPVEGINNKIRTVMRRGYGIRNIATLWSRVILDVNWTWKKVGQTIVGLRQLVARIQAHFTRCYT
jgi:transposase